MSAAADSDSPGLANVVREEVEDDDDDRDDNSILVVVNNATDKKPPPSRLKQRWIPGFILMND